MVLAARPCPALACPRIELGLSAPRPPFRQQRRHSSPSALNRRNTSSCCSSRQVTSTRNCSGPGATSGAGGAAADGPLKLFIAENRPIAHADGPAGGGNQGADF